MVKVKIQSIMMSISLFLLVTGLLIISDQNKLTGKVVNIDEALENLDELKEEYNENVDRVPRVIKNIFGDEKIKATLTRLDGSIETLSVNTRSGIIQNLTTESFDEYTLNVEISEETINEIVDSENQVEALLDAIDNEDITYEAVKVTTKVKLGVSKFFLRVFSWFR